MPFAQLAHGRKLDDAISADSEQVFKTPSYDLDRVLVCLLVIVTA